MKKQRRMRHCKNCRSTDIFRAPRHGFLQKRLYSLVGLFPWECPHFRRISMLADRGDARGSYRRPKSADSKQQ
jgi:hypothetical protein